ncbi:MAG: zinc ribbon domain-containing protein [Planctomycetes bacterium]|nr:zinc ribbon domain-containing protein [Planctomycetota bacterium]
MPTYDYACARCGHRFEAFHGMTEPVLRRCPECGRETLERLIGSGAGVLFKGSGFYETDYKRPAAPKSDRGAPAAKPADPPAGTPAGTPSRGPAAPDQGSGKA